MKIEDLKIYYLEDDKDDFLELKSSLVMEGARVYPNGESKWSEQLQLVQRYIGAAKEEKTTLAPQLESVFTENLPDLIILDFYIKGDDSRYLSKVIYHDILVRSPKLADIPVIFLTRETDEKTIPAGHHTSYILKPDEMDMEGVKQVIAEIKNKASEYSSILQKSYRSTAAQPEPLSFTHFLRLSF